MKKKILLTLSACAMVLPVAACQPRGAEGVKVSHERQISEERAAEIARKSRLEGYKAVKAILDVYVSHLPGKLESLISNDFVPNKHDFINHIEHAALDKTIRNIEVIVDDAVFTGNTFSVTYSWTRTYLPRGTDYYSKDAGTTNFIFVKEVGGWRLKQMSGADIF